MVTLVITILGPPLMFHLAYQERKEKRQVTQTGQAHLVIFSVIPGVLFASGLVETLFLSFEEEEW